MRSSAQIAQQTARIGKAQCEDCGSIDGLDVAGPKIKTILLCSFCKEERESRDANPQIKFLSVGEEVV